MCIRDRPQIVGILHREPALGAATKCLRQSQRHFGADTVSTCLLYTSDAADERSSVDLGGRRIIKKKKNTRRVRRVTNTTYKTTHSDDVTYTKQKKREKREGSI